jgi:hypothetical protein
MKIPPDYRPLAKRARKAGWTITGTRNGHLAWTSPTGRTVFSPSTPSDRRSLANVVGKLRRAGLDVR